MEADNEHFLLFLDHLVINGTWFSSVLGEAETAHFGVNVSVSFFLPWTLTLLQWKALSWLILLVQISARATCVCSDLKGWFWAHTFSSRLTGVFNVHPDALSHSIPGTSLCDSLESPEHKRIMQLTFDDTTVSQCHSWDGSDARGKVCGWREIIDQSSLRAQEITNFLKPCFWRFAARRGTCVCTALSLFLHWHMRFHTFRHFWNNRDQRFNQAPVNQTTSSLGTNTHHSIRYEKASPGSSRYMI